MNFIFISPHFPKTYWNFADRLNKAGINVLGIGDASYDSLAPELKNALQEYYFVSNMEDYEAMRKAVAYFIFKYGKIDWLESNNEYWLEQDARLRTDFNIETGVKLDQIEFFKSKHHMKEKYRLANIPIPRDHVVASLEKAQAFIKEVGYPIIAKPDHGVGASNVYKIENEEDLQAFFAKKENDEYVMEEFIDGDIVSYDAISDKDGNPLFEAMTIWPPSIADIVNCDLDLAYWTSEEIDEKLREYGRRALKAFQAKNRFVHMEFFRLNKDKKGLGKKGDLVGLEVNMRPAGGYTPDMMNYSQSLDVYQIYTDMVQGKEPEKKERPIYYSAYASQKDGKKYVHSHQEILDRYKEQIVMCERMPEMMVRTMGNQMYTVKLNNKDEVKEFIQFVHEKE